jgi:hypothetical protein
MGKNRIQDLKGKNKCGHKVLSMCKSGVQMSKEDKDTTLKVGIALVI